MLFFPIGLGIVLWLFRNGSSLDLIPLPYLKDCPQYIALNGILSRPRYLSSSVPQGSILRWLLFSLFTAPLENIISAHTFDEMMYADDTQLYIFMRKVCHVNALENRTLCLDDITSWNLNNNLDCTVSKTEIIHFSLQFSPVELIASITVGDHYVQSTSVVKDLGVMLESVESCTCSHSFAFILFYWQNQKTSFTNWITRSRTCHWDYTLMTLLYASDVSPIALQFVVNQGLSHLLEWFDTNYLLINNAKTQALLIGPCKYDFDLTFNGSGVTKLPSLRILGVELDSMLNFMEHISSQLKNAYAKTGPLRRIRHIVPMDVMLALYKSFILPHLEYCSPLLLGVGKVQANKIEDTNYI